MSTGFTNTLKQVGGGVLSGIDLAMAARRGSLAQNLIARQTALADPEIRASLTNSPATSMFLGVGGDTMPQYGMDPNVPFLDRQTGSTFIPRLPPATPEQQYKQNIAQQFNTNPNLMEALARHQANLPYTQAQLVPIAEGAINNPLLDAQGNPIPNVITRINPEGGISYQAIPPDVIPLGGGMYQTSSGATFGDPRQATQARQEGETAARRSALGLAPKFVPFQQPPQAQPQQVPSAPIQQPQPQQQIIPAQGQPVTTANPLAFPVLRGDANLSPAQYPPPAPEFLNPQPSFALPSISPFYRPAQVPAAPPPTTTAIQGPMDIALGGPEGHVIAGIFGPTSLEQAAAAIKTGSNLGDPEGIVRTQEAVLQGELRKRELLMHVEGLPDETVNRISGLSSVYDAAAFLARIPDQDLTAYLGPIDYFAGYARAHLGLTNDAAAKAYVQFHSAVRFVRLSAFTYGGKGLTEGEAKRVDALIATPYITTNPAAFRAGLEAVLLDFNKKLRGAVAGHGAKVSPEFRALIAESINQPVTPAGAGEDVSGAPTTEGGFLYDLPATVGGVGVGVLGGIYGGPPGAYAAGAGGAALGSTLNRAVRTAVGAPVTPAVAGGVGNVAADAALLGLAPLGANRAAGALGSGVTALSGLMSRGIPGSIKNLFAGGLLGAAIPGAANLAARAAEIALPPITQAEFGAGIRALLPTTSVAGKALLNSFVRNPAKLDAALRTQGGRAAAEKVLGAGTMSSLTSLLESALRSPFKAAVRQAVFGAGAQAVSPSRLPREFENL